MIRLHDFIYSFTQRVGYLATVCFVIQLFHFGILAGGVCPSRGSMCLDGPLRTPPGHISILHFSQTKNCSQKTKFFLPIKESRRILVQVLKFATHFEEQYIICNTNFGQTNKKEYFAFGGVNFAKQFTVHFQQSFFFAFGISISILSNFGQMPFCPSD